MEEGGAGGFMFNNLALFSIRMFLPQSDGDFCHYTPSPSVKFSNITLSPMQMSPSDDPAHSTLTRSRTP